MRQVTRKGLITMAAAGGVLALSGGYAHADSGAAGGASNSPGVLSGNSIQVPIDVPVNVCGNSVDVVGLLNPTGGNDCGNGSADAGPRHTRDDGAPSGHGHGGSGSGSQASGHGHGHGGSGSGSSGSQASGHEGRGGGEGTGRHRAPGASAQGEAKGSPGIGSGNQVQVPVEIPVNLCGNSVTIGGLLNPVFGNSCENDAEVSPPPVVPQTPHTPEEPALPPAQVPPAPEAQLVPGPQLAQTGAGGLDLLVPASAGLLLAGAGTVLYRRSRSAA
ncbi:chaplin family protein [Streptomyces sp. NPDC001876]|uniref:chaplin n=1 Tax=Streptomyces sp. NPDC001876 TaxID=3154402 RepID=UPI0033271363